MQQSSSDGCLVKQVATETRQDRQKSAGVEGPLGARGPGSVSGRGGQRVEELRKESFVILPHPIVLEYMLNKTTNYDRWIGGMNKLMRKITGLN